MKPFYGRRKTHTLTPHEQHLMTTLLPALRVQDWGRTVHLEIGFGHGDFLCDMALKHPEDMFVGCDVYVNGIASLLKKIEASKISNIFVYDQIITEVLRVMPDNTLDHVYILFPDPWPKHKHHKRRLLTKSFLLALMRKLKVHGIVHIVTDHSSYQAHIAGVIKAAQSPISQWPEDWMTTKYAQKALNAQRLIKYYRLGVDAIKNLV